MEPTELWSPSHQRSLPKWLPLLAAVLLALRFAAGRFPQEPRSERVGETLVKWVPLAEAQRRAEAERRPLMYDFSAEWCEPCKQMDRSVFRDKAVAERLNRTVIPVRITDRTQEEGSNPPEIAALQKRYAVIGFPTLVFADPGGLELARLEGMKGSDEVSATLERVVRAR
jgi:thiol:disulfide interchange protein DsbD